MINPSEIKLWNYIKIDGVETELDYHVMGKLFKNSNADLLNKLEGIPITPELLEKCGFKKEQNEIDTKSNKNVEGRWIHDDYLEWPGLLYLPNFKIKYLHQLQNLYYSLTGKELEIKL